MRCDECGYDPAHHENPTTHCAPPFARQPHAFTGLHPAERRKVDTSQLGRICIDPNDDRIRAVMVREALRRTGDYHMKIAAEFASDEAKVALYRMLNP